MDMKKFKLILFMLTAFCFLGATSIFEKRFLVLPKFIIVVMFMDMEWDKREFLICLE